jgi:Mn-dependent DtxR family transcriptional regulator
MIQMELTELIRNRHYPPVKRSQMQGKILDYLATVENSTNKEMAHAFGVDACSITGRTFELRAAGLVEFAGERICARSGNRVAAWRVKR